MDKSEKHYLEVKIALLNRMIETGRGRTNKPISQNRLARMFKKRDALVKRLNA